MRLAVEGARTEACATEHRQRSVLRIFLGAARLCFFPSIISCKWAATCLWRIDTAAVKRSEPRNALQLRRRTPDDFIRDFCRGRPDTAASANLWAAPYSRKSRRSRQFPSALDILKRQSKNSATHNAGKMRKKANTLACQTCQLRAP